MIHLVGPVSKWRLSVLGLLEQLCDCIMRLLICEKVDTVLGLFVVVVCLEISMFCLSKQEE